MADNENGAGTPPRNEEEVAPAGVTSEQNGAEAGNEVERSPVDRRDNNGDENMERERSPAYGRDQAGDGGRVERERSPRRRPPPPPPGRDRDAQPSSVLGCFGLSIRTRDIDLEDEFNRYGHVEKAVIVYDQRSERSRGFGFVTMRNEEEANRCIEKLNGIELHGRNIRVAYSMTTQPHASTPGEYMGFKTALPPTRGGGGGRDRFDDRDRRDRYGGDRDRGYGRPDDRGYGGGGYRGGRDRDYGGRDAYDDRRRDPYDDRRGGGYGGGRSRGYDDYDRAPRGGDDYDRRPPPPDRYEAKSSRGADIASGVD